MSPRTSASRCASAASIGRRSRAAWPRRSIWCRWPDIGGRAPRQLSGGQQQRVAIARAIIFRPRVLLMDEPLSALDKKLREDMQLEIKHLHQRLGITFVYVTHDQREALVMSDRVAVMNDGRIEQLGAPAQIYDRPANHFVASFIGESNFIAGVPAKIAAGRGGAARRRGGAARPGRGRRAADGAAGEDRAAPARRRARRRQRAAGYRARGDVRGRGAPLPGRGGGRHADRRQGAASLRHGEPRAGRCRYCCAGRSRTRSPYERGHAAVRRRGICRSRPGRTGWRWACWRGRCAR